MKLFKTENLDMSRWEPEISEVVTSLNDSGY